MCPAELLERSRHWLQWNTPSKIDGGCTNRDPRQFKLIQYCSRLNGERLKKKQWILGLVALLALAALLFWGRDRIHFDFGAFRAQVARADWSKIGIGFACIYAAYAFRSVRWALLMRHNKKVGLFSLLGTQVIGFTAVALIGRVADPVRPYLVSKKTGVALSSQFAVYIVERLFDAEVRDRREHPACGDEFERGSRIEGVFQREWRKDQDRPVPQIPRVGDPARELQRWEGEKPSRGARADAGARRDDPDGAEHRNGCRVPGPRG